ncbi:MAG: WD40 repeat domain-containing protein [Pseudonocardiales bacterium]|nr:WD40 repeat domain-containing protein [Pseudonocardiales bacterium]
MASYTADRAGAAARLILIVDQFEEVFTLAEESERQTFIDVLQAISDADGTTPAPAVVVLGMRADFSQNCFGYPPLEDALQHRQRLLPAMTIPQLTEAIERPAEAAGVKVEPALVQLLLQDAGLVNADGSTTGRSDAGTLPLLSHALRITWDKRRNQRGPVTAQAYLDVGRLRGAVEQTADGAWNELTEPQQAAGLWILLNLVHIGADPSRDTRNPREWRELLDNAANRAAAEQARDVFVRERLLTADTDTVQITHETLMRSWPRLANAINKHRDGLVWRQRLDEAATAWEQSRSPRWWRRFGDGRDPELLWRSANLDAANEWAAQASELDHPSALGQQFLRRCTRKRTAASAAIGVVISVLLVLSTLLGIATVQTKTALATSTFTQVVAEADRLRVTDTSLAAQLYLTAYRMQPTPALYTSLLETENEPLSQPLPVRHTSIVRTVVVNGTTLASAADDGTVQLWAMSSRPTLASRITESGPVTGIAITPDGTTLVSAQDNGTDSAAATIQMWKIADPAHPAAMGAAIPAGIGHVRGLAISPDGKTLASVGGDGATGLWNVTDPAHLVPLGARLPGTARMLYGTGVTFSPDGNTLAIPGDDGTIRLWNVTDPATPVSLAPLQGGSRVTYAIAYSTNRKIMVTGGGDTVMRIWDVTDPTRVALLNQPVTTPGASILSIAVSPDGTTVAAATADNTVSLWNITDPAHPVPLGVPLTGHGRGVGAVAFSPDGQTLVTGSADSTVRLWALPPTRLVGPQGNVTAVAFSHNGRILAVAGADNSVRLWDTTAPTTPVAAGPALRQDGFVNAVAFNRDDTILASGGYGKAVRLWNVTDPKRASQLGTDLGFPGEVGGLAISPDGQILAVGCADGTIRLFTLTDPAHPQPLGASLASTPNKLVGTVRFSPDGKVLATAGADHQIWLWDTSDPTRAHSLGPPLARHTDKIYQLTFSPDGKTLGSVGADHTARLWNVADPARADEIGPPLQQQTNAVGGVSYSPDGKTLATGSDDKTVVLWNVTDPTHGTTVGHPITGHINFIYTVGFSPDSETLASGGRDHTVLLWQLNVDRAIQRICQSTAADLNTDAWNTYVSRDVDYNPPCT